MSQYIGHFSQSSRFNLGSRNVLLLCLLLILAFTAGPIPPARAATTLMVNTADDVDNGACNSKHCSLREAIATANHLPGPDVISFSFTKPKTITILSPLPALTNSGTTIQGMGLITLDGSGTPDGTSGLLIHSSNNKIQGLTISGFPQYGVLIEPPALYTGLSGNVIGTDGNGSGDTLEGNVIVNNGWSGVYIHDTWPSDGYENTHNVVAANYLGVGADGTTAMGNGGSGVGIIYSTGNRIGTNSDGVSDLIERNVISDNELHGVYLGTDSTQALVSGNYIGVTADGATALGNGWSGVAVWYSDSNQIEGNVVSNNVHAGIILAGSSYNVVIDNHIGTDPSGTLPMGNEFHGLHILGMVSRPSSHNRIGYIMNGNDILPHPNVIAYNYWNGLFISSHTEGLIAKQNAILYNAIFENELLGIDLVSSDCPDDVCTDGVTINDLNDTDGGANDALNYPTITSAGNNGSHTLVQADIVSGLPNTELIIQFFSIPTCDPSGYGEGQTYLGEEYTTTDSDGLAFINTASLPTTPVGSFVTATATSYNSINGPVNTSEFSACYEVTSMSVFIPNSLKHMNYFLGILAENGQLDEAQAAYLSKLVDATIQAYEKDDTKQAISYMDEFLKTIKALIDERQLSTVEGHYLLDMAQIIIDLLGEGQSR